MLGPSASLLFYYNQLNIAQNPSIDYYSDHSNSWLMFLSAAGEAVLPLHERVQVDCGMSLSVAAIGAGSSKLNGGTSTPQLLTAFRALAGRTEIGVRYFPIENISVRAGYTFMLLRVDSWDHILAGSDNAVLTIGFHF